MANLRFKYLSDANISLKTIWAWAKQLVQDLNAMNTRADTALPAGMIMSSPLTVAPEGWLLCDGSSVAVSEYPDLFLAIAYNYGGSGGLFFLPDFRDRILIGAGTLVPLYGMDGAQQATLAIGNLPAHNHGVTDPGHTHPFTGASHTHGINDPGHTHTGGFTSSGPGAAGAAPGDIGNPGITTGSSVTAITVSDAIAGGSVDSANTGITTTNTGAGAPFDVLNPVAGVNVFIKT